MLKLRHLLLFLGIFIFSQQAFSNNQRQQLMVDTAKVYLANASMECGKTYAYDVKAKDLVNLINFQFSINFNNTLLKAESVTNINPLFTNGGTTNPVNTGNAASGRLEFAWANSSTPINVGSEVVMFTINFKPYYFGMTGGGMTPVEITNNPTDIQAIQSNGSSSSVVPVKVKNGVVTIEDKTKPMAICPNSQFYRGLDSVLVASIFGNATDDCGEAKITSHQLTGANNKIGLGDANGKYYKLGTTRLTYTATDLAGNTNQCVFKIVLVKNTNDTLTLFAGSKLISCGDGNIFSISAFIGNANGKNINDLKFSLQWNKNIVDYQGFAGVNPFLSSAAFNTSNTANGQIGFSWAGNAVNITDNMKLFTINLKLIGNASASELMFGAGPTPMTANSATLGSIPVQYIPGDILVKDETAPMITCKNDMLLYENSGVATATNMPVAGTSVAPSVVDNCAPESTKYTLTNATNSAEILFNAATPIPLNFGTTNIKYKVTDYGGNTSTCAMNVKVNRLVFNASKDSIPCSISQSKIDIKVKDFEKLKDFKYTIKWNPAMLSLNTSGITYFNNTISSNLITSGNPAIGELTFTWNLASGSETIPTDAILMSLPFSHVATKVDTKVEIVYDSAHLLGTADNIKPLIINGTVKNFDVTPPIIINCPSNISDIVTQQGVCSKTKTWTLPTITDNCDNTVSATTLVTKEKGTTFPINTPTFSGDNFTIGTTLVKYTAKDVFGNTAVCTFNVTVSENAPPVITQCTPNINTVNTPGLNGANVTWNNPSVNESCGIQSEVFTKTKNAFYKIGKTSVVYTVTDNSGNAATCAFNITVSDNEKPVFTAASFPKNITINNAIDTCGAFPTWAIPQVVDNHTLSNLIQVTSNKTSGTFFPVGLSTVLYTAQDSTGNLETKSFTVTVIDNQAPKFLSCPSNVTLNATAGLCAANYTPLILKTKDNCNGISNISPSSSPANNNFPVGETNLAYTDPNDQSVTCSYKVIVKSVEKPQITCANDITINSAAATCGITYNPPVPTTTDVCGTSSITTTNNYNSNFYPVGATTVTFKATDQTGNTSTCAMKITVQDKTPPVIVCVPDIIANADPSKDGKNVTWVAPNVTDNCSTSNNVVSSLPSNTYFKIGKTDVTYTATDQAGNSSTCVFSVTVLDKQAPVINCPPTNLITVNANPNDCGQNVPLPTITDNSGKIPTITASNNIGVNNFYPVGKTIVSFTVSDEAGNTAACTFTVHVKDIVKPTFASPVQDVTITTDQNDCKGTLPTASVPVATDACNNTNITITRFPNITAFPVGTTTVIFTATDQDGNSNTTSIKVTVEDKTPPTLTCPQNVTVSTDLGKDGKNVTWTPPTVIEACTPPVTLVASIAQGTYFKIGKTDVTYTATDKAGNVATCSFSINVVDTQAPIINCPTNNQIVVTASATPTDCGQTVPLPTFFDNNGKTPTIITSSNIGVNNFYPVGKTTVSFTVSDEVGNTAVCTFIIEVKDGIKPGFSAVSDITIDVNAGGCTANLPSSAVPTATDGCSNANVTVTSNPSNTSALPVGTTTITYTVTDQDGNTGTTSFKVTVKDNVAPTITCVKDITVNADFGKDGKNVTWLPPSAQDACTPPVAVVPNITPNSYFKIGKTDVVYTATDKAGNTATCIFVVTVLDNQAPVINCPPNNLILVNANATPTDCGQTVLLPTFTDNSGVKPTIITSSNVTPNNFYPVGKTIISFTVSDEAGNTALCTFTIDVKDGLKPAFSTVKDITVPSDANGCTGTLPATAVPTASDGCSNTNVTVTVNPSGTTFPVGTTTIVYTATDQDGNTGITSFKITVTDNSKPVITSCPTKIVVNSEPGKDGAIVPWTVPTATDNCGVTMEGNFNPGDFFKTGITPVKYIATDAGGNTAECIFDVEVKDTEKPIIDCKNIVVINTPGDCSGTIAIPNVSDNVSVKTTIFTPALPVNNIFPVGTSTTYIMSVTDAAGNTATCPFTVKVEDKEAPKFTSASKDVTVNVNGTIISDVDKQIVKITPTNDCKVTLDLTAPKATDNCSTPTVASNTASASLLVGKTPYTFIATDAAGNTATYVVNVTVIGIDAPLAWIGNNTSTADASVCKGENVQLKTDETPNAKYAWTGPNGFTSALATPTITAVQATNVGAYSVKVTKNGCESPASKALNITMPTAIATGKNDTYTTLSNTLLSENVLTNDGIAAGTDVIAKVKTTTKYGSLKMRNDGVFDYQPNKNYVGQDDFTYEVCYEDCFGTCSEIILAKITIQQEVTEPKIPNVLTPNGDGFNDTFIIDYPFSGQEKSELYIYNEWGHVVFQIVPFKGFNSWDATYNGKPVPDGTYFYAFKLDEGKPIYKGFITVLR